MRSREAPPDRIHGQHACAVVIRATRGFAKRIRVPERRGDEGRWPQVGDLPAGVVAGRCAVGSLHRPRRPRCRELGGPGRAGGDRFRPAACRCGRARAGFRVTLRAAVNLASGSWNTRGRPLGDASGRGLLSSPCRETIGNSVCRGPWRSPGGGQGLARRTREVRRFRDDPLDELLAGAGPAQVFAGGGVLDDPKKAVAERALNAEMDAHPEHECRCLGSREAKGFGTAQERQATPPTCSYRKEWSATREPTRGRRRPSLSHGYSPDSAKRSGAHE